MTVQRIWPVQLAQVVTALPNGRLSVILEDYALMGEITVRCSRPRAHPSAGSFVLPENGDFGLVCFYRDDMRSGVWLGCVDDGLRNMVPEELWEQDPFAEVHHHPSDKVDIQHGDGTTETRWPDGSLLKLTTRKDGTLSNAGERVAETPRKVSRKTGNAASERQDYSPHTEPPVDVVFKHSSGAQVLITADGSFDMKTPKGHRLRLHDGTEKVRDVSTGEPTGTPEEDAGRVASEITVETEQGFKFTLHDDPEARAQDRYAKLETPGGHSVELRDLPAAQKGIKAQSAGGHLLHMDDKTPKIQAKTPGGRELTLDDAGGKSTLTDPSRVDVNAPLVNLAGGGPGVARLGDQVQVVIGGGSSAGTYTGVIITASSKVKSG